MSALLMESMNVWGSSPVNLNYKRSHPSVVDGNMKPSKAPVFNIIPLTAFLDTDNLQLVMTTLFDGEYDYYIYDDNGDVIMQGALICVENGEYNINLSACQSGTYTVVFVYEGNSYEGIFEIEE